MSHIARQFATVPVTFVLNTCESDPVDFGHFAGGVIYMSPVWDTASIGFKVSPQKDTLFNPLYDKDNSLVKVTLPNALRTYPLPDELYGARQFKLHSVSSSGSDVVQTTERIIFIMLKG